MNLCRVDPGPIALMLHITAIWTVTWIGLTSAVVIACCRPGVLKKRSVWSPISQFGWYRRRLDFAQEPPQCEGQSAGHDRPTAISRGMFRSGDREYGLEHLYTPATQFREISRILRPGGVFIFHTPNRRGYLTIDGQSGSGMGQEQI